LNDLNANGKKRTLALIAILLFSFIIGCFNNPKDPIYDKFEAEFIGVFDVKIQIIGYDESKEAFTEKASVIYDKMHELHKLYDIYNDYEGIANIKTINDNAGIAPVKVDRQIIDLILLSKEAYERTDGLTNLALGSVLKIWHDYRIEGIDFPEEARLPKEEDLKAAALHANIDEVIVDEENSTVYLADPDMRLDVGAIAKGFAAELAKEAAVAAGLESGILDAGGNVLTIGAPRDGVRDRWGVGVQDPARESDGVRNIIDTVYLNDKAVVTSGMYQRYYVVDGRTYNHIIDPRTLFPADHYAAVTVIHENSGIAEYLSTAIFIASYEDGLSMAKANGAEVLWVYPDGELVATEGYEKISKLFGAYSATD
jgi:thiamine biosynthesis lipoprotein